ncbi:MAG: hypothetical protein ACYTHK_02825 [Planctomycetota bacterium]
MKQYALPLLLLLGCGEDGPSGTWPPTDLDGVARAYVEAVARGDGSHAQLEHGDADANLRGFSATVVNLPAGAQVKRVDLVGLTLRGTGGRDHLVDYTFTCRQGESAVDDIVDLARRFRVTLADGSTREGFVCLRPERAGSYTAENAAANQAVWRVVPR